MVWSLVYTEIKCQIILLKWNAQFSVASCTIGELLIIFKLKKNLRVYKSVCFSKCIYTLKKVILCSVFCTKLIHAYMWLKPRVYILLKEEEKNGTPLLNTGYDDTAVVRMVYKHLDACTCANELKSNQKKTIFYFICIYLICMLSWN